MKIWELYLYSQKKTMEILKSKLKNDVQFIKLNHSVHGECYAVSAIKVLDCIDEKNSIIKRMPSGRIFTISKYVFKGHILYPYIFKITTDNKIGVFVNDEFINDIKINKLTGF